MLPAGPRGPQGFSARTQEHLRIESQNPPPPWKASSMSQGILPNFFNAFTPGAWHYKYLI